MHRERRLRVALALNLVIVAVQIVAGIRARSLGLLADAGHNVTDVLAIALSVVAVRLVRRRPTPSRSFGWHRSTILAAQANAVALLVVTVVIAFEAVRRLIHPVAVASGVVVVVGLVSMVVNGLALVVVHDRSGDLNTRSVMIHLAGDALGSAGVAIAGAVMMATGGYARLDPAVSLLIGAAIAWHAWKLVRATADVLLESSPAGLDLEELAAAIGEVEGVEGVHDLHVWSLSSEVRALSAHLVLAGHPTLEEAQLVGSAVKDRIGAGFEIAHATLELECEHCADDMDDDACAMPGVDIHITAGHHH